MDDLNVSANKGTQAAQLLALVFAADMTGYSMQITSTADVRKCMHVPGAVSKESCGCWMHADSLLSIKDHVAGSSDLDLLQAGQLAEARAKLGERGALKISIQLQPPAPAAAVLSHDCRMQVRTMYASILICIYVTSCLA